MSRHDRGGVGVERCARCDVALFESLLNLRYIRLIHQHAARHVTVKIVKPLARFGAKVMKAEVARRQALDPSISAKKVVLETVAGLGVAATRTVKVEDSSLVLSAKPLTAFVGRLARAPQVADAIDGAVRRRTLAAEKLGITFDEVSEIVDADLRFIIAGSMGKAFDSDEVQKALANSVVIPPKSLPVQTELSDLIRRLAAIGDDESRIIAQTHVTSYLNVARKYAPTTDGSADDGGFLENLQSNLNHQLGATH